MARPLYRAMRLGFGGPDCGPAANKLGVRVPSEPPPARVDLVPDLVGFVQPKTGGMSVFAAFTALPISRLPTSHGGYNQKDVLFVLDDTAIVPPLAYLPDHGAHGTIQPVAPMPVADYQGALCDTKPHWRLA